MVIGYAVVMLSVEAAAQQGAPPRAGGVEDAEWPKEMARVHARFTGRKGTFAQFGDSITESHAFWSVLQQDRRNISPEMQRAHARVDNHLIPECWRGWKGPEYGNQGGQTIGWADEHVVEWLKRHNPEAAIVMFGTNDLGKRSPEDYEVLLRSIVRRCLDHGTVVILSTIPPRHGMIRESEAFADAARRLAREMALPLVDYHAEILKRRPDDWDGATEKFAAYEGYDVPTLMSRDGVHPSAPQRFSGDYSEEALRSHGYNLRNFLVLMRYAEVLEALHIFREKTASEPIQALHRTWHPKANQLPQPTGDVIRVATVESLHDAVSRVKPGGTILLADGTYSVTRPVVIEADGVTLRSESGERDRVVLDGGGTLGELVKIRSCKGARVADLTVQNVRWNGIKLDTDSGVHEATIRNCVLRNIWQRAIKGVIVPAENREATRPKNCVIEYCLFSNDRAKRFEDDPADTAQDFDGNYVGGIDVMYATGWAIRDNVFVGIRGRTGNARGAIFLWHDSRDCVVERNIIVDCDSGICLGNSHKPDDVAVHCTGIVVRNNLVCRAPENGILVDYTRDCAILHNTVHDPHSRLQRLIRVVHDNDGLRVVNNLLSGPPPRMESGSRIELRDNAIGDFTSLFTDATEGNLRLNSKPATVIGPLVPVPEASEDIDRRRRGPTTVPGAHDFEASRR
jgi:nitrous oxidase accessory protein NosD